MTSRRLASLPGVHIDLGTVPEGEAYRLLASIVGEERMAARPSATQEVLRACGGMPLALRLAGARLAARPAWTVQDLARRLSDHGRALGELYADDLYVRTALHMRYALLLQESAGADPAAPDPAAPAAPDPDSGQARAFRLLGLMPSVAFGTEAAALLACGRDVTEDWLEALVDAHLLESPEPGRYQCHCLVRALARLVEWCLRGTDAATVRLAPAARRVPLDPAPPPVAFASFEEARAWCEREHELLIAGVPRAHESGLHAEAWMTAAALWSYVRLGSFDDWLTTHRVGLAAARATGDERAVAWMLNGLGNHGVRTGQPTGAIHSFRRALEIHRRAEGRDLELSSVLNSLGICYTGLGDHRSALRHYEESLDLDKESAATMNNIADALGNLGRQAEALDILDRALATQRATGDRISPAIGLRIRGEVLRSARRPAEAAEAYRRATALQKQLTDVCGESISLVGLGDAHADQGARPGSPGGGPGLLGERAPDVRAGRGLGPGAGGAETPGAAGGGVLRRPSAGARIRQPRSGAGAADVADVAGAVGAPEAAPGLAGAPSAPGAAGVGVAPGAVVAPGVAGAAGPGGVPGEAGAVAPGVAVGDSGTQMTSSRGV